MDTRSVLDRDHQSSTHTHHHHSHADNDNDGEHTHSSNTHSESATGGGSGQGGHAQNLSEEAAPFFHQQQQHGQDSHGQGDRNRTSSLVEFAKEIGVLTWGGILFMFLISMRIVIINAVNIGPLLLVWVVPMLILGVVYRRWLRPKISIHANVLRAVDIQMVRMFFGGAIPGTMLAMVAESVITIFLVILFFYEKIEEVLEQLNENGEGDDKNGNGSKKKNNNNEIEVSLAVIVFLLLTAYVVAGLTEEAVKLLVLRYRCSRSRGVRPVDFAAGASTSVAGHTSADATAPPQNSGAQAPLIPESMNFYTTPLQEQPGGVCTQPKPYHPYATVALLMAVGAGFSTMENLFYVFPIDTNGGPNATGKTRPHVPGFSDKMFNSVGRVFISLPIHIICATLTAIRLGERDRQKAELEQQPERANPLKALSYLVALLPAVLFHGTFDAVLMILAALQYNNLAVMIAFTIFMVASGLCLVYAYWRRSKALYNANVDCLLYHSRDTPEATSGSAHHGMSSSSQTEIEMRTYP
eukprot:gb/GECG01006858.1/.p1 GENE.gb/GECG01006858.1/~~gb/GECG01006858.1/.p1  ORF type:complete len:525 (+),score=50.08 gb/GECG01006858.1/:1-1575(+)